MNFGFDEVADQLLVFLTSYGWVNIMGKQPVSSKEKESNGKCLGPLVFGESQFDAFISIVDRPPVNWHKGLMASRHNKNPQN